MDDHHRLLTESSQHCIARVDREGRFLYVNPKLATVARTTQQAMLGKTLRSFGAPPDIIAGWEAGLAQALAVGKPVHLELRVARADGFLEYEGQLVPEPGPAGGFETVLAIVREDSEERLAASRAHLLAEAGAALAASLAYETTLRHVAQLIVPLQADWCLIEVVHDGSVRCRIAAHDAGPDPGVAALLDEAERHAASGEDGIEPLIRSSSPLLSVRATTEEIRLLAGSDVRPDWHAALDGKSFVSAPLVARARFLGTITLVAGTQWYGPEELALVVELARRAALAIDNALLYRTAQQEREAAQAAVRRTAALQEITAALSVAATPGAVAEAVVTLCRRVLGANAGIVALRQPGCDAIELAHGSGSSAEVLTGWSRCPLATDLPITRVIRQERELVLESCESLAAQFSGMAAAHHLVAVCAEVKAMACFPLTVAGKVLGALCFAFAEARPFSADDLGFLRAVAAQTALALERARLFAAEQAARAAAQEAVAAKDRLIALVSHELRNPLAAIHAGLEVLRRLMPQDERVVRTLELVMRNTRLQVRLVNDLLDLSRLARGTLQLQRVPVALDTVVFAALQAHQAEAGLSGLELLPEVEERLWVHGDADRLQQLVMNLLSNAIKFTPQGGTIWLRATRCERGGVAARGGESPRARLEVRDTGIGIDPSMLERVFGIFEQGAVGGRHRPGLGIGLALVKMIAEHHGGRVFADSPGPGRGSRFVVELPLIPQPGRTPSPLPDSGRPLRVLLVEDNPDTRVLLAEGLIAAGHEVRAAESAEQALSMLGHGPGDAGGALSWLPEVLVSDIGLPGMDGFALLLRLRSLPGLADLPAFAVTAYSDEDAVTRGREAGFIGHFVKPIDLATLNRSIREYARPT